MARNGKVLNPTTGRWINVNGETFKKLKNGINNLNQETISYNKHEGPYKNLKESVFCGPNGNAGMGSFPVNTEKRCRAALSYAYRAPNPNGIIKCAIRKAKIHGWECGTSSEQVEDLGLEPAYNNKNQRHNVGGSQFINVPGYGKRKVRYQKNGRAYVRVNKRKLKLN